MSCPSFVSILLFFRSYDTVVYLEPCQASIREIFHEIFHEKVFSSNIYDEEFFKKIVNGLSC